MSTFLKKLQCVHQEVMRRYPDAFFYEADLNMTQNSDGETFGPDLDWTKCILTWGRQDGTSVQASFNDAGRCFFTEVDSPWLEDRPMTPYIPCDLTDAYKRLGEADFTATFPVVSLRFQLNPKVNEPQYFFGTPDDCYTVGVYSAEVL